MTPSDLQGLLERVEAASGADRKLDAAVYEALTGVTQQWGHNDAPRVTGSIDAALALVERRLPGWGVQVGHPLRRAAGGVGSDDTGWYASVFRARRPDEPLMGDWLYSQSPQRDSTKPGYKYAANGALAILAALLRSELSRGEG